MPLRTGFPALTLMCLLRDESSLSAVPSNPLSNCSLSIPPGCCFFHGIHENLFIPSQRLTTVEMGYHSLAIKSPLLLKSSTSFFSNERQCSEISGNLDEPVTVTYFPLSCKSIVPLLHRPSAYSLKTRTANFGEFGSRMRTFHASRRFRRKWVCQHHLKSQSGFLM